MVDDDTYDYSNIDNIGDIILDAGTKSLSNPASHLASGALRYPSAAHAIVLFSSW